MLVRGAASNFTPTFAAATATDKLHQPLSGHDSQVLIIAVVGIAIVVVS